MNRRQSNIWIWFLDPVAVVHTLDIWKCMSLQSLVLEQILLKDFATSIAMTKPASLPFVGQIKQCHRACKHFKALMNPLKSPTLSHSTVILRHPAALSNLPCTLHVSLIIISLAPSHLPPLQPPLNRLHAATESPRTWATLKQNRLWLSAADADLGCLSSSLRSSISRPNSCAQLLQSSEDLRM